MSLGHKTLDGMNRASAIPRPLVERCQSSKRGWLELDAGDLGVSCYLCSILGSLAGGGNRADLKGDYGADYVRIDRERFHLSTLAEDDKITASALEGDLRCAHKSVVGGLRVSSDAICGKIDLIDSILKRLSVIAASRKRESLVWCRGNAAA